MEVPYLINKPSVIPINTGRQLFVDDFLIAESTLTPVPHTPRFYEGNPVLQPDLEWEKTTDGAPYAAPFSDGIWFDESDGKFKMWYLAGAGSIHKQDNQTFYTCYAESADGIHWKKPQLPVVPGTNIVDTSDRDSSTVWLDRTESDPTKRWKFFNVERRPYDNRWQVILKYSADGIHWSKGVAQSGDHSDRSTAFYNPFTNKWVLSLRAVTPVSERSRFYIEHEDPEMLVSLSHRIRPDADDKFSVFWFTPDDKELRHERFPQVEPGIYNFDAIPYESIMLGFYTAWAGPDNNTCKAEGIQKRNVISLGYSRDGFHFSRPSHQAFMNVNESDGAWNWGNMQSVNGVPIIVGDWLYFYASGRRRNSIMWDSYTSTGLAFLRRDGFVAMHAEPAGGYLITEPLSFDGKYMFVNTDLPHGDSQLSIELLDAEGRPIPEFSENHAAVLKRINSTKAKVVWPGSTDLSSLIGKTIRIRFSLTHGDLYSFWISPWPTGESRGYTAGGGPNLSPAGQDIPLTIKEY